MNPFGVWMDGDLVYVDADDTDRWNGRGDVRKRGRSCRACMTG